MSSPADVPRPESPSIFKMYRSLVGVGILCGFLIVSVFELTKPIIAKKQAEALRKAVVAVVPKAVSSEAFEYVDGAFKPIEDPAKASGFVVYAGYGEDGALNGVALTASAMGYADVITTLYGYSFEKDAVVGTKVLSSKETPGLGDKIEKDETFLQNFEALDVSLTADGSEVANPVTFVKSGEKEEPWQIDSITGATISSKAMAEMLRKSTVEWVPILEKRQGDFEKGAKADE